MKSISKIVAVSLLVSGSALSFADQYSADKLPSTMAWTAYQTSSASYAQLVAIGNVLKSNYGTSVRILPGDNDVSRLTPLKTGRVDLCGCGIASYYAAEGVHLFSRPDWGPQPIRVISSSIADFGMGLVVAGDIGVETPADLEGKRVAWVRGAPALNQGTEAFLAFGGLTWDDVERVEFPGYSRTFDGIIQDQADAAFTMTSAPAPEEVSASPRGVVWPELDPDNKEGWGRLTSLAPFFQPHSITSAAGGTISKEAPHDFASYPYPALIANEDYSSNIVYNLIKVITEDFDSYKNSAPGAEGYALESQNMFWVIPFHDAVVDYYKEIGHWTDEMQAHQDKLVKRQQLLLDTWDSYKSNNPPADEEAFQAGWMEARATALEEAGMNPVFY